MSQNVIKVFREGKGTQTRLQFDKGLPEHTLHRAGAGQLLPGEFSDLSSARAFALGEVQKDPSAVLHIVDGKQILDTVVDQEFQIRRNKRQRFVFAVVTSAAVLAMALCVSIFAIQFTSPVIHGVFTGGMTLLYLILLAFFGARNIRAFIFIVFILVMTIFLAPAVQKLLAPDNAPAPAAPNITEPRR